MTTIRRGRIVEWSSGWTPADEGIRHMGKRNRVKERTLMYQDHRLTPEDFLHFVELDEFRDDWETLRLDDDDIWTLQILIMCNPTRPPVIKGTGGLRKLRFAPERWNVGKSDAVRVCYVYFPDYWTVLLVAAYGKNEKDNLTDEEKAGIRTYIKQVESWLAKRNY